MSLQLNLTVSLGNSPFLDALNNIRDIDDFTDKISGPLLYQYSIADIQLIESFGFYVDTDGIIKPDPDDDRTLLVRGWHYDLDSVMVRPVMRKDAFS